MKALKERDVSKEEICNVLGPKFDKWVEI